MRMLVYDATTLKLFVTFLGGHSLPIVNAEYTQDAIVTAAGDRRVCVWSLGYSIVSCFASAET